MDTIPLNLLIVLIILLGLSAFFSSAETSLSSANKIRIKNYAKDSSNKNAKKAYHLIQNFDQTLSTILVGNNLVNIAASISASIATDLYIMSTW